MNIKLLVDVKLEVMYNPETNELDIVSCSPSIVSQRILDPKRYFKHKMTKTQLKYGILTLGARTRMGQEIPLGKVIDIKLNDKEPIQIKTHRAIKGRIDGLTRVYAEHPELIEGAEVEVSFDLKELLLNIKTL